jgi:hypothetical protein
MDTDILRRTQLQQLRTTIVDAMAVIDTVQDPTRITAYPSVQAALKITDLDTLHNLAATGARIRATQDLDEKRPLRAEKNRILDEITAAFADAHPWGASATESTPQEIADLPALDGSPKQIAWAEKLRADATTLVADYTTFARQCLDEDDATDKQRDEANDFLQNLQAGLRFDTKARTWIDGRDDLLQVPWRYAWARHMRTDLPREWRPPTRHGRRGHGAP